MKIILLSGGSGKRLWPLSNDTRSKQFLKVLESPDGGRESMIQRVVRQIKNNGLTDDITIATGQNQKEAIEIQLGDAISIVTEPCRRDTFPAIMLTCTYLANKGTSMDEPIIVMPCDTFTEDNYFKAIAKMAEVIKRNEADIALMGIEPTYPSTKYGYIIPDTTKMDNEAMPVIRFTEKPDEKIATEMIAEGALWNGGIFAFRLGYLIDIVKRICPFDPTLEEMRNAYNQLPKISFDYAVVEKANSIKVVPYNGEWKDLGTWNVLTEELKDKVNGNVTTKDCENTYIINELDLPMVCMGTKNMVIAATPDGILVTELSLSEGLKDIVGVSKRPMYERRNWGRYKVIDSVECENGFSVLSKHINLEPSKILSFPALKHIRKTWVIIEGEGEVIIDGLRKAINQGDVIKINQDQNHTLIASTQLDFIEVQTKSSDGDKASRSITPGNKTIDYIKQ